MSTKTDWEKQATNILKAELTWRGLNYEDLRLALEKIGIVLDWNVCLIPAL